MDHNKYIILAIDGAAGSGKSTTSKLLCEKFNYIHVDTGLHYRSLCCFFKNNYISADGVNDYLSFNSFSLSSAIEGSNLFFLINGIRFSLNDLRNEEINKEVSYYARLPRLRSLLLSYQRNLPTVGKSKGFSGIVVDGRDIGSVVFPNADLKFFLHADLHIRQKRRIVDGERDSISGRDKLDRNRKVAPLSCPAGATSIDTGSLSVEEVIDLISNEILSIK